MARRKVEKNRPLVYTHAHTHAAREEAVIEMMTLLMCLLKNVPRPDALVYITGGNYVDQTVCPEGGLTERPLSPISLFC